MPHSLLKVPNLSPKEKEQRHTSTDNDVFILLTWPGHRAIILHWLITCTLRRKPIKMNFIKARYVRHWDVPGFLTLYSRQESLHQLASSVSLSFQLCLAELRTGNSCKIYFCATSMKAKATETKGELHVAATMFAPNLICSEKWYNVHLLRHNINIICW